ncbi:MAG TPA: serine hydrolase domain-containing protein [Pirellulales bacterium]|jgi:CubicO group peptidase (beta-lactamase class C family)|nr:serine hydrolase domain-containing protein [Pirellulales bacterium]
MQTPASDPSPRLLRSILRRTSLRCAVALIAIVGAAATASAQSAPPGSSKEIVQSLQPFVEAESLAGAVALVASKDNVLSLDAVGYADVAAKKPMQTNDLFWIASMSKAMTASALMMLVDEGKVHVDDPVEKYLPDFHGQMVVAEQDPDHELLKKAVHPITVKNVLTHTSGLPFMSRAEHKIDQLTLHEAAISYALTSLRFQPDSKWDYSNAGINTAGRIVEVVSGMPYEEFMDKRLFQPLGMKDTTFWPNEEQLSRLAKSYKAGPHKKGLVETDISQLSYPLSDRHRGPSPAGGLFSTATDVSLFCRMLLGGGTFDGKRYLSEASVRQMTSTQDDDLQSHGHGENGYGFGLSTTRKMHGPQDPPIVGPFGHGGAYATDMWIDPEQGLVTVFMVQSAGFPGNGGQALPSFKQAAFKTFGKK